MFGKIMEMFGAGHKPDVETPLADADHAFGALLVRMAKVDSSLVAEELKQIDTILANRFNLNVVEAARFRADCERLNAALPDTSDLTEFLVQDFSSTEREQMFQSIWYVLMADGKQHERETEMMAEVAQLFGIGGDRAVELASSAS